MGRDKDTCACYSLTPTRLNLKLDRRINSIREDPSSLTTFLAAEKAPWSDIGGSYEVDFAHTMAPRGNIERRGFIDAMKGNFDETRDKDFDVSLGHRDKLEHLWHDDR